MVKFLQTDQLLLVASVFGPDESGHGSVYVLVLTCAALGGAMHGVSMAVRKYYGESPQIYWMRWKWWVGIALDGVSGLLIWPAMPLVPVEFLIPLVMVVQLSTTYILGYLVFEEMPNWKGNCGIVCSMAGVAGLSLSSLHNPESWNFDMFLASWLTMRVVIANASCLCVLSASLMLLHRSIFLALAAGFLEGLQYLCSRSLAAAVYDKVAITHVAFLAALGIKGTCIVMIIHLQQLGLECDFSRFAGIYLMSSTLFMCTYGAAFFGDHLHLLSPAFLGSATTTLIGIWLLNEGIGSPKDTSGGPLADAAEQRASVIHRPGDSVTKDTNDKSSDGDRSDAVEQNG